MEDMATNAQLQFITWLITTTTDKRQTIEEVRELNAEIRKHSNGLIDESEKKKRDLKKPLFLILFCSCYCI